MHPQFTHLHVHSEHSLLDGACKIVNLVKAAKEKDFKALALTDHGSLGGIFQFYHECIRQGIKPIVGCEMYLNADPSGHANRTKTSEQRRHLLLLAKNQTGYKNLLRLTSKAWTMGFYGRPRIDFEMLKEHHEGLICSSGCVASEVPQLIFNDDPREAEKSMKRYWNVFGKDYYLELGLNELPMQAKVNRGILEFSKAHGLPLIITNDVHYVDKDDAKLQDILLLLRDKKTLKDLEKSQEMEDDSVWQIQARELYLKTPEDVRETCQRWHSYLSDDIINEAFKNTHHIAAECKVEIKTGDYKFPHFVVPSDNILFNEWRKKEPDRMGMSNEDAYFYYRCYLGYINKIKPQFGENDEILKTYRERIKYEREVISSMGFSTYFLIIEDIVQYAKQNNVFVGCGRGSVGGSLVAYALNITDIDPIKHNLYFERFLVPGKVTMPDIDIDFEDRSRDFIIQYIVSKYKEDHVSLIGSYGRMNARGAIKDVARVYEGFYEDDRNERLFEETNKVTKCIFGDDDDLEDAMKRDDDPQRAVGAPGVIRKYALKYPEIWEVAKRLEGQVRHMSVHAAGVVITPGPVTDYLPVHTKQGQKLTAWTEGVLNREISSLGLLKVDILGLSMCSILSDTLKFIEQTTGKKVDLNNLDLNDQLIYKNFSHGFTDGVFQYETQQMKRLCRLVRPNRFDDLVAINALVRPVTLTERIGNYSVAETYALRKRGLDPVSYIHPVLENILKDTYGVMCYQEQGIEIARQLANYDWKECDYLRKTLLKIDDQDILNKEGEKFISRCITNGMKKDTAEEVWKYLKAFSAYGFNKAHACAYAMIGFQSMYLRVYYKTQYMCALLKTVEGDEEKFFQYFKEAIRIGVDIEPPDINRSKDHFFIDGQSIVSPLTMIDKVGPGAIEEIVSHQPYTSKQDMLDRVMKRKVNKRVVENLEAAGALFSVGVGKQKMNLQEKLRVSVEVTKDEFDRIVTMYHAIPLSKALGEYFFDKEYVTTFAKIANVTQKEFTDKKTGKRKSFYFIDYIDHKFVTFTTVCWEEQYDREAMAIGTWLIINIKRDNRGRYQLVNIVATPKIAANKKEELVHI